MNITLQQLINQWKTVPNKFEVGVGNFEVRAAKAAVSVFKESFHLQRFNSPGNFGWKARRDGKSHPILIETGSLMRSIKWQHLGQKGTGVRVYTDPNAFMGTKRHKGFCFAAVHNAKDGTYTYGNTGVRSVQRQYIGHSTVLKDKLEEEMMLIFKRLLK